MEDKMEKIVLGVCKACDCNCGDSCLENNNYKDCFYANEIAESVYNELYGEEDNDD